MLCDAPKHLPAWLQAVGLHSSTCSSRKGFLRLVRRRQEWHIINLNLLIWAVQTLQAAKAADEAAAAAEAIACTVTVQVVICDLGGLTLLNAISLVTAGPTGAAAVPAAAPTATAAAPAVSAVVIGL